MNNLVSLKQLRTRLTDYTALIEDKGLTFIVLRKSKPVFKIIPVEQESWETVVDFTQIDPAGAPLSRVKKTLEKMLSQ